MKNNGIQRLEEAVRRLVAQHGQTSTRAAQLAAALAKSREELEKLKAQNFRFRNERSETRRKIDGVLRRIDRLAVVPEGQVQDEGD